jgi:PAS domain S-box-containing protein
MDHTWVDTLLSSLPAAIAVYDRNLRFVRINERFAAFMGVRPEAAIGKTVIEILGPALQAEVDLVQATVDTGRPVVGLRWRGELPTTPGVMREWEYSAYPFPNVNGEIHGVLVTMIEVTEQVALEAERTRLVEELERRVDERSQQARAAIEDLAAKSVQLEEAQRIAQIGSWEFDMINQTAHWSRETYRIYDVDPSVPASFGHFIGLVHPEDRSRVMDVVKVVMQTGVPADLEYRLVTQSGKTRIIAACNRPFFDDTGKFVRLIGTNQDVTERREMEKRLVVQDRMSALGCLAAGLAHEINNPLSYVLGNADLALEETDALAQQIRALPMTDRQRSRMIAKLDELVELITDSREGGNRVRAIVKDMKTFARGGDDYQPGPVDLRTVIESTANLAANEIRHRAQLVCDFGTTPLVLGTDSRIGEVVLNILINAAQAIAEGDPENNQIRVVTRTDASGYAQLEISDTGCGIAPEHLGRIFDPFYTTKPIGSGTGLGLSICHSLVQAMGGTISVASTVGQGTTFRLTLPPTEQKLPSRDTEVQSMARSAGRVLVIDDEPMVVAFSRRCLDGEHEVVGVTDANLALERLAAGETFDVIVCDIMMPKLSGIDFFRQLEQKHPELTDRVVFMTGGTFTHRAQAFLDEVPNARLEKPFEPPQLRALIRERVWDRKDLVRGGNVAPTLATAPIRPLDN